MRAAIVPAERLRRIEARPFPPNRRAVTQALRAGRRIAPIHGLFSVDVTRARELLASEPGSPSLTAFILACVGQAAAAHPEVHAYRDWRGRLITHRFVDVVAMIEVGTDEGSFPLAHVVRDADIRPVADIGVEIRRAKDDPRSSSGGRLLTGVGSKLALVPGAFTFLYLAMARSSSVRRMAGTVSVTSVGMFAGGEGFGIGLPTLPTLAVLVGGSGPRPRAIDGVVEIREMLDLTVTVDHNVVDGAPAARFIEHLRDLIESAQPLI